MQRVHIAWPAIGWKLGLAVEPEQPLMRSLRGGHAGSVPGQSAGRLLCQAVIEHSHSNNSHNNNNNNSDGSHMSLLLIAWCSK